MENEDDHVTRWVVFDEMVNKPDMRAYAQIKDDGLQDDLVLLAKIERLNGLRWQFLILRTACVILTVVTVGLILALYFKPFQT